MRLRHFPVVCVFAAAAVAGAADTDSTVDWLLSAPVSTTKPAISASAPASRPSSATQPATPLVTSQPQGARRGVVILSDGARLEGAISTTDGKPLRFWQEDLHKYADLPFAAIDRLDAVVVWEREEKEWHFVASGSDIKEYTGRSYPARETAYEAKMGDQTIKGGIVAPIYIATDKGEQTFVLHKRDKGPLGGTLKDLIYIKSIEFKD